MNYPHLRARIFNTPLMARLDAAQYYANFLDQLERGDATVPRVEGRVSTIDQASRNAYIVDGGVGVLTIEGPLVQRAGQINPDCSPITSYQWINAQLSAMADDPEVKAILLEFDSPGGEVANVFELGARLRTLSDGGKPVWAVANEGAFSAGYALAAGAERILLPATAMVGSVGVIMLHVDASRAIDKKGYTVTPIFAGARKNDFSSMEPLSRQALAIGQARIDELYTVFTNYVADQRGMPAEAVRGTEAGIVNADEAVRIGLADEVATLDQTLGMLQDHVRSSSHVFSTRHAGASTPKGAIMAEANTKTPAFTAEDIEKARAEGSASATAELTPKIAAASKDGASAERARVAAILDSPEAEGRSASAKHLALKTTQTSEEAIALLATMPKEAATSKNPLADAMGKIPNPQVGADVERKDKTAASIDTDNVYAMRRKASGHGK